jgi:hypothetical protein
MSLELFQNMSQTGTRAAQHPWTRRAARKGEKSCSIYPTSCPVLPTI